MKCIYSFIVAALFFSCSKETFTYSEDANTSVYIDTLRFDTVFTQTGSITKSFKIFNNNNKSLRVSSISLANTNTPFQINVNGVQGPVVNNITLAPYDSMYVFVKVNIDANNEQLPFLVQNNVEIQCNNNKTLVNLQAYGQNAHYIKDTTLTGNKTWNNDLPYVILNSLQIAPDSKLTITKGCRIYMHANAAFTVQGTLEVLGSKEASNQVLITNHRLDAPYNQHPGSWPGITFTSSSKNNVVQYAVIKNATNAIQLQPSTNNNAATLVLAQTQISNASEAGITATNSSITAQNLLVYNCSKNLVLSGGNYQFTHCTVAAYSTPYLQQKNEMVFLSNTSSARTHPLQATFTNCIFWMVDSWVNAVIKVDKDASTAFNVLFNHVLWNQNTLPPNTTVNKALTDTPLFETIQAEKNIFNFRLKETSPAIDNGANTNVSLDIEGNKRPVRQPDIGAYEQQ